MPRLTTRFSVPVAASIAFLLAISCSVLDPNVGSLQPCASGYGAYTTGYGAATSDSSGAGAADAASPMAYGRVSGHLLISDQYDNRVIEVTREGAIVWSFGDGSSVPGPTSIVAPNDAERLPNGTTLIAGTGGPPGPSAGADPACPTAGCPDNRVIIVDDVSGAIVWQYGDDHGVSGSGPGQLSSPISAVQVPVPGGDDILITDQGNHRVIEVSTNTNAIVWEYPALGSEEAKKKPTFDSAERLPDQHTLITDAGKNQVVEVDDKTLDVVWRYPAVPDPSLLSAPGFASRLPDGHTLVTDTGNGRVVELDASSPPNAVWSYSTAGRNACGPPPQPSRAVRLENGHTLIADQFNDQVLEVDHASPANLVYTYGKLGVWGKGPGLLWAPYDAKVVGDYTGLTLPR